MCVCVCACVRVCVRACVRACVRVCINYTFYDFIYVSYGTYRTVYLLTRKFLFVDTIVSSRQIIKKTHRKRYLRRNRQRRNRQRRNLAQRGNLRQKSRQHINQSWRRRSCLRCHQLRTVKWRVTVSVYLRHVCGINNINVTYIIFVS